MRRPLAVLLLAAPLLTAPAALAAQEAPTRKSQVVSINPLALVLTGISGEYEHRTGSETSVALGASLWSLDDFDYSSVDAKFRFYPSGTVLQGFSVAGTAGYTHAKGALLCLDACDETSEAIGAGVELNYQWLLGRTRSFATTVGVGAKRLFYVSGDSDGASTGVPTIRLSIGYAF
ncbi:MAG TPA: DUF3575 domain-containing protein [Gemmatimonadaceae bacterium]|nr:DUF3575 domain-containing protein [Gemmatimonadaceae bacterium]